MMRRLGLGLASIMALGMAAACTGPEGPAGQDGKDGTADPSVSAVFPTEAFLGHTLDVSIAGNGTSWTDATTVSFSDEKITVNKVTAASGTGLVVNVTIAANATVGAGDVTVKDTSATETFKGAFKVVSPLRVTPTGSLAQGSIISVHARDLDFATPFDTTATGDGFLTPLVFTNITVNAPAGTHANLDNVSEYAVDYRLFVDVTATPGDADVVVKSGPAGDLDVFPSPAAFTIAARAPQAATAAAFAVGQIQNLGDTALFSYAAPDATVRLVDLQLTTTDADASPIAYFLPKSGKFTDLVTAGGIFTEIFTSTDPVYAVVLDQGGYAGYTVKGQITETNVTPHAEKEPNDDQAAADTNGAVTLPYVIQGASLSASDEDWIAVTIGAADVGKKLWVQTTGWDGLTDTVVDILDSTGKSLAKESSDTVYLDSLTSAALTKAGTYYVKVFASSEFDATHNKYDLVIRLK
jgi:hypothetical protein